MARRGESHTQATIDRCFFLGEAPTYRWPGQPEEEEEDTLNEVNCLCCKRKIIIRSRYLLEAKEEEEPRSAIECWSPLQQQTEVVVFRKT